MYQQYYGLKFDPFALNAGQSNLYSHESMTKARSYLQYGLTAAAGMVLITGEGGTGKTTVINDLLINQQGHQFSPVVIDCADFTGYELVSHYASLLTGESQDNSLAHSIRLISETLEKVTAEGSKPVLILDDAHLLSDDALAKVHLLNGLHIKAHSLLHINLVGLPDLRYKLLQPNHAQLHQRLTATCNILPLNEVETTQYIVSNLKSAGWTGQSPKIDPKVLKLIYGASLGNRNWINLICSRLLLQGLALEKMSLDHQDICLTIGELIDEDLLSAQIRESNSIHLKKNSL